MVTTDQTSAPAIAKYVWSFHLEHIAARPANISPVCKIAKRNATVRKYASIRMMEPPTGNNLLVEAFGFRRYNSTPAINCIAGTDVFGDLAPHDLARCWPDGRELYS